MARRDEITPEMAVAVLIDAFAKDPDYGLAWHDNIAMAAYDAFSDTAAFSVMTSGDIHAAANDAAGRFMSALGFDSQAYRNQL